MLHGVVKIQNRPCLIAANVKHLVIGSTAFQHQKIGGNHILNIDKIPDLPAIFKNGWLFAQHQAESKYSHGSGIGIIKRLARSLNDGITHDNRWNIVT